MEENLGSFKELYDVHLKTTQNIEINGRVFEEGETIALFNKIQISGLTEFKDYTVARSGFGNIGHVYWENTKSVRFTFSQGVFSNTQFGILNNAKVIQTDDPILVTKVEELETDEVGRILTTNEAVDQIFIYNKETCKKIPWWRVADYLKTDTQYTDVIIHYRYNYTNSGSVVKIGQRCLKGFLELEGKTRVKDDTSGLITTGIIKIPKLKLMSGLSMKLGAQASPVVGTFEGEGVPVESKYNSYVMEIDFLNNDIDSDM